MGLQVISLIMSFQHPANTLRLTNKQTPTRLANTCKFTCSCRTGSALIGTHLFGRGFGRAEHLQYVREGDTEHRCLAVVHAVRDSELCLLQHVKRPGGPCPCSLLQHLPGAARDGPATLAAVEAQRQAGRKLHRLAGLAVFCGLRVLDLQVLAHGAEKAPEYPTQNSVEIAIMSYGGDPRSK